MAEWRESGGPAEEERTLDPWFAAARSETPEPPLALLSAILGDAAEVSAERVVVPAEDAAAEMVAAKPVPLRRQRRFDGIGGWKGLAALAACAAMGFWAGIAGQVTVEDGALWTGHASAVAETVPEDPVGAFFDLASVEG